MQLRPEGNTGESVNQQHGLTVLGGIWSSWSLPLWDKGPWSPEREFNVYEVTQGIELNLESISFEPSALKHIPMSIHSVFHPKSSSFLLLWLRVINFASRGMLRKKNSTQLHCFKKSSHSVKDPKYSQANQLQCKIHPVLRSELAVHFLAHDTLLVLIYPLSKRWFRKWVLLLNHLIFHCKWQLLHFYYHGLPFNKLVQGQYIITSLKRSSLLVINCLDGAMTTSLGAPLTELFLRSKHIIATAEG